jgi:hypothetical protein
MTIKLQHCINQLIQIVKKEMDAAMVINADKVTHDKKKNSKL